MSVDVIIVYKSLGQWRWTRKSGGNYKVVGASSEGYSRKEGALKNIKKTQKEPYDLEVVVNGEVT